MWERLRRFSALERPAQEFFLRAVVLLPLVALSLRWRGFRETQAALERFLSKANPGPDAALASKVAAVTAHMVNAADRHGLVHPSCLAKSLTLLWLLGRQGIPSHLRVVTRIDMNASASFRLDRLKLSRQYMSAESVCGTCGFMRKTGNEKGFRRRGPSRICLYY